MKRTRWTVALAPFVLAAVATLSLQVAAVPAHADQASNEQVAFNYFTSQGLTEIQSAAIVGNFVQESNVDPTSVELGGGPGRGIAQWGTGGRWDTSANNNMLWFASQRGVSPTDLTAQLQFTWYELTTFGYGYPQLKAATDLNSATNIFMTDFENCAALKCGLSSRQIYAQQVLSQYGSGSGTPVASGLAKFVYQLHADGSVYQRAEGPGSCTSTTACSGWNQIDGVGSGDRFVAGSGTYAYALHSDGSVFQRPQGPGACTSSSACTGWSQVDSATGGKVALAASGKYLYVVHSDGSLFQRPQGNGSCPTTTTCTGWSQVDSVGADTKAAAGGGYVFALHPDGSVFQRPEGSGSCPTTTSCTGWSQVDGAGSGDTSVAASGKYLYALHKDGSVFERPHGAGTCSSSTSCTGWTQVDGVGSDVGIGGTDGYLHALHSDGSVFSRPEGPGACSTVQSCTGWSQIDAVGSGRVMVS